jgi:hypothetical protein
MNRPFLTNAFNKYFSNPYYRQKDTYKDSRGVGIFERFINTLAGYFDGVNPASGKWAYRGSGIGPDIDNVLDILDIGTISNPGKAHEVYLNYLWDYFGQIPYAYGVLYLGKGYSRDEINALIQNERTNLIRKIPETKYRDLLRYVVSLYKIRGTKQFYETIARYYGFISWELIITEQPNISPDQTIANNWEIIYDIPEVQYDEMSNSTQKIVPQYDTTELCDECSEGLLKVKIDLNILNTWQIGNGTITNPERDIEDIKKIIAELVNYFLPINVKYFSDRDGDNSVAYNSKILINGL